MIATPPTVAETIAAAELTRALFDFAGQALGALVLAGAALLAVMGAKRVIAPGGEEEGI